MGFDLRDSLYTRFVGVRINIRMNTRGYNVNINAANLKARGRSYDIVCKGYIVNPLNHTGNHVYHLLYHQNLLILLLNVSVDCI